jgi:hypothetical protein
VRSKSHNYTLHSHTQCSLKGGITRWSRKFIIVVVNMIGDSAIKCRWSCSIEVPWPKRWLKIQVFNQISHPCSQVLTWMLRSPPPGADELFIGSERFSDDAIFRDYFWEK